MLVSPMPSELRGSHRICRPKLRVRLRSGDRETPTLTGLLDTGADITFADQTVATFLGITEEDLRKLPAMDVRFAGNVIRKAYRATLDLLVQKSSFGQFRTDLEVAGSSIYFSPDVPAGVQVLLGQHDFLERLVLTQMNQQPDPRLKLNYPGQAKHPRS